MLFPDYFVGRRLQVRHAGNECLLLPELDSRAGFRVNVSVVIAEFSTIRA